MAKVDGQISTAASTEFRAPATVELSAEGKAAVESGVFEQRKLEPGQSLWLAWKAAPGKTSWEDFQKVNSHLFDHPLTNRGDDVRPGYPYLVKKETASAADPKPQWSAKDPKAKPAAVAPGAAAEAKAAPATSAATAKDAGGAKAAGAPAVVAGATSSPAKTAALDAAATKLKASGYEPTPANLKPEALAAELTKRALGHTSMDYDFMNAALAHAHASGTVEGLNTAVAGQLAARPATDAAATAAKIAAAKLAGKDGSLRALIGMQTSDAAKKASEDVLTTGVDQHRASTAEKVGEQFIRIGKSIGESFRDHPVIATASLLGGAAAIAALPFVAAGAAAGAMLLAGGTGAAALASGAAFGYVATGAVGLAATAYGVHKGLTAAEKLYDAHGKAGAARDQALEGIAGDLISSAGALVTAFTLRPRIVGAGAAPGPGPMPAAPRLGGPPELPRLGLSPEGLGVSPAGTPALPPPGVSLASLIIPPAERQGVEVARG